MAADEALEPAAPRAEPDRAAGDWPAGVGSLGGALAGAVVGAADGLRAAVAHGGGHFVATAALAAAVDALAGLAAGAGIELLARVADWGRRARPGRGARVAGFVIAGAGAAAAAAAVVSATALRRNRFLAAGLTALAAAAVGLLGALLAPALARLLGGRSDRNPGRVPWTSRDDSAGQSPAPSTRRAVAVRPRGPGAAFLVGAPLAILAAAGVIFAAVARTRAPLHGPALIERSAWSALAGFLLPALLVWTSERPSSARWGRWGSLVAGLYGVLALVIGRTFWEDDLRFAPWTDLLVGAAVAAVAIALVLALRKHLPKRRGATLGWAAAAGLLGALALFRAAEVEGARKAGGARAALVGPVLQVGQTLLDGDGDGYARALGGGDCDDSDPDVHPGATDLPGDGIDADCDGQDASQSLPPPAVMAPLPAGVPPDLNLLLVTIDTLRADHLGCYGYVRPTSPAIDALAAAGALFENGWAHAPSTRYSMPAIATGRWPSAITWDESIWWPRMGRDMRTTAEALHDDGYFTAGMFSFSYFAIGDHRGFERGMDLYRSDRAVLHVAVNGPMESRGSSSREMTDDAIAFVDAHKDHKFFLWLHYYDPHLSYEPHAEVPAFGSARVDLYDGEIRYTDLHFGRLLEHLRQTGLWDRTAIVLTGDHGEGFGEHGVTEHGFDLYTAQTKVPFIVRVPGLSPRRVTAPAGHVDIAPTLVNLARGHVEPSFIGRSLIPDLAGAPAPDSDTRAVFQEVTSERGKKRAFVTSQRHLIWNETPSGTTECYDRRRDPSEARDIWDPSGDADCVTLARDLKRLVAGLGSSPAAAQRLAADVTPPGGTPPAPSHPADVRLGDLAVVRGYDLAADVVRPNGSIDAAIYWAPVRRMPREMRLVYRLEGAGWHRDLPQVPIAGLMPLGHWRPGQQLRDRVSFRLPGSGAPSAGAGVYTVDALFMVGDTVRARAQILQVTVTP